MNENIIYNPPTHKKSLWCWDEETLDEVDILLDMCSTLNVDCIYQEIETLFDSTKLTDYINTIHNNNMDFYFIFGKNTFYNDLDIVKSKIDIVDNFNKTNPSSKVEGVIFDVEPYGTGIDGIDTPVQRSRVWAEIAKQAYLYANSLGVRVIYCNPVWYPNDVISSFTTYSDGLSYMNYVKPHLVEYISDEMQYSIDNNKWIEQISEFQDPIRANIKTEETFYFEGIHSAHKKWEEIKKAYPYDKLSFSYHYYRPLLELIDTYIEKYLDSYLDDIGLSYLVNKTKKLSSKNLYVGTEAPSNIKIGDIWGIIE